MLSQQPLSSINSHEDDEDDGDHNAQQNWRGVNETAIKSKSMDKRGKQLANGPARGSKGERHQAEGEANNGTATKAGQQGARQQRRTQAKDSNHGPQKLNPDAHIYQASQLMPSAHQRSRSCKESVCASKAKQARSCCPLARSIRSATAPYPKPYLNQP